VVKAAERTEHGMLMERVKLIEYINYCQQQRKAGISEDKWYMKL